MPKFVGMMNWTDQGIKDGKHTVDRYQEAKKAASAMGITMENVLWTLGEYDLVCIFDAPDEETAAALMLMLGSGGNLRTKSMRAFTETEMTSMIEKLS